MFRLGSWFQLWPPECSTSLAYCPTMLTTVQTVTMLTLVTMVSVVYLHSFFYLGMWFLLWSPDCTTSWSHVTTFLIRDFVISILSIFSSMIQKLIPPGTTPVQNFIFICPVFLELKHMDGQMDGHDQSIMYSLCALYAKNA